MTKKKTNNKTPKKNRELIPDDKIARLRVRLNKKREYIAILELELQNTRAALYDYNLLYNERILPLEQKLRYLRRLLYEFILNQKDNGQEEEPMDFGEPDEPDFTYEDRDEADWRQAPKKPKKAKNPRLEEQIRELFRELAKRFHPDLTSDPEEKKYRQEIMTKVNVAYANRDLKALQALAEQPDRPAPSSIQSREDEILALQAELVRLDGVIAELKASINHLEESPAMKLMMESRKQRRNGKDLLTGMEKKLKEQIDDLEERLLVLGLDVETLAQDPSAEEEIGEQPQAEAAD